MIFLPWTEWNRWTIRHSRCNSCECAVSERLENIVIPFWLRYRFLIHRIDGFLQLSPRFLAQLNPKWPTHDQCHQTPKSNTESDQINAFDRKFSFDEFKMHSNYQFAAIMIEIDRNDAIAMPIFTMKWCDATTGFNIPQSNRMIRTGWCQ